MSPTDKETSVELQKFRNSEVIYLLNMAITKKCAHAVIHSSRFDANDAQQVWKQMQISSFNNFKQLSTSRNSGSMSLVPSLCCFFQEPIDQTERCLYLCAVMCVQFPGQFPFERRKELTLLVRWQCSCETSVYYIYRLKFTVRQPCVAWQSHTLILSWAPNWTAFLSYLWVKRFQFSEHRPSFVCGLLCTPFGELLKTFQ